MSSTRFLHVVRLPVLLAALLAGCSPLATIKSHQVGACNDHQTGNTVVAVGKNAAYVVFKIESIDNTQTGVDFHFDPERLYINQSPPRSPW